MIEQYSYLIRWTTLRDFSAIGCTLLQTATTSRLNQQLGRGSGGGEDNESDPEQQGRDNERSEENDTDSEEEYIPLEEIRDAACTPIPADEEELEYTKVEYERVKKPLLTDMTDRESDSINFVFVITDDEAESRLNPELGDEMWSFIEETDFDKQVLLIWDWSWDNTSEKSEVVGITRSDAETIHAYICQYGSAGGHSMVEYTYFIRVNVSQKPQQAKLTYQEASGHRKEDGITTQEKQFDSE